MKQETIRIVLEIPEREAPKLRIFAQEMRRKGKPTKGIPGIKLIVDNCRTVSTLECRHKDVSILGLPDEEDVEVGDVVRIEQSGNWGKVLSVRGSTITIKASRESRQETGQETFVCDVEDVEVLV